MATISATYYSGTISSISGLTTNVSGGATSAWVGRCIRMKDGVAKGQIRKIATYVNATQITVDYAWDTSPFVGFTEVIPNAGDSFAISYYLGDIVDGSTIIADPGNTTYRFVGASSFSNGVFIYSTNARIDLTSSSITTNQALESNRVCFRFGDVDALGNVYNGCSVLDVATAPAGFGTGTSGTFDTDFHFYAGTIRCTGAGPFWRFHSDSSDTVRIVGSYVDGNLGGRFIGSKSILKDWSVYNMASASGPFNPKAPFGLVSNIKVSKSLQAFYHYWTDSKTLEAEGIKPDTTTTKLVRFANNTTSGEMLTIKDVSIPTLQAMSLLYTNSNGTYSNTFRISQYLNSSYVNIAGSPITSASRFVIKDVTNATIYNSTTTSGSIPKQTLRYRDMTILNVGDYSWSTAGGTTYAPYNLATISYNYTPAVSNLPLLTSQTVSLIGFVDSNITQTNKSIVDSYTSISNLDQLYDVCKSWSTNNLDQAIPSFGSQLIAGNGSELNLGAMNLVIDSTLGSLITVTATTISIKSAALIIGTKFKTIRTTGTLSFVSSSFSGNYIDSTGSYVAISISGLVDGSRVQVYNVTDSIEIDNFIYNTSYKKILAYTSDKTIRIRATYCSGLSAKLRVDSTGIITSNGVSFLMTQVDDTIYISNAIDGSTITEFTISYPNFNINGTIGSTSIQRLYAWYKNMLTTSTGISNFYGGMDASDISNYIIHNTTVNITLNNTSTTPVKITGGYLSRDDGNTVISPTSYSIQMDPRKAYLASVGSISTSLNNIQSVTNLIPALL